MYVNPFPFGVFIGVIGTVLVEIVLIVGYAAWRDGRKKK